MTANDLPLYDGPVADTETMEGLGRRLGGLLRAGDLVVLTGPLGAGKTTFTRGVGEGLQVRGQIASPTFVLARTHPSATGVPLVHVDAYRLGGAAELDDLDLDFEGSVVVVEWAPGCSTGSPSHGSRSSSSGRRVPVTTRRSNSTRRATPTTTTPTPTPPSTSRAT